MLIGVTFTYNNEALVPYVMPYVERLDYDKFIVYDNLSTDRTVELLKQYPFVEVRSYDSGGIFDEDLKNQLVLGVYQEAFALSFSINEVWLTITDFDEVIFSNRDFKVQLAYAACRGYNVYDGPILNMFCDEFPNINDGRLVHTKVTEFGIWPFDGSKPRIMLVNGLSSFSSSVGQHAKGFDYGDKPVKTFGNADDIYVFHLKYLDIKNLKEYKKITHERLGVGFDEDEFNKELEYLRFHSFDFKTYSAMKAVTSFTLGSYADDYNKH